MRSKIAAMVAAAAAAVSAAGAAKWARGRKHDDELELEVTQTVGAPPVSSDPASDPPAGGSAPAASGEAESSDAESADDLTAIKGLGKVKASKLVAAGVTSYAQVAAWSDDDIAEMGLVSNTSPGQIKREDWVGQARTLSEG